MSKKINIVVYTLLSGLFVFCVYMIFLFQSSADKTSMAGAALILYLLLFAIFLSIPIVLYIYKEPKKYLLILFFNFLAPISIEAYKEFEAQSWASELRVYNAYVGELEENFNSAWREISNIEKVQETISQSKEKLGKADILDRYIVENNTALLLGLGFNHQKYRAIYIDAVEGNINLACHSSKILTNNYKLSTENEFVWVLSRLHNIELREPAESCISYDYRGDFSFATLVNSKFYHAAQLRLGLSYIAYEEIIETIELTLVIESRPHRVDLVRNILENVEIFKRNRIFNTLYYANTLILLMQGDPDLPIYVDILSRKLEVLNNDIENPEKKWKFEMSQKAFLLYLEVLDINEANTKPLQEYFGRFPAFLAEYYQKKVSDRRYYTEPENHTSAK